MLKYVSYFALLIRFSHYNNHGDSAPNVSFCSLVVLEVVKFYCTRIVIGYVNIINYYTSYIFIRVWAFLIGSFLSLSVK